MAVRIRLKKLGRRHRPFFRVCAMDSRSPRDGRVIEELGTYDPMVPETDARALLRGERIDYWLSVGAKPTPKVGVLIRKYGTGGSHLDAQQQALERLSSRRGMAIEQARRAAEAAAAAAPAPQAAEESAEAAPAAEASEAPAAEAAESADSGEAAAEATPEAPESTPESGDPPSESGEDGGEKSGDG